MNNQPINDLRLMFLERIAIETPEAAARLFELRDAGKWQAQYCASADWLDQFLRAALGEGQGHMDWIRASAPHLWLSASAAALGELIAGGSLDEDRVVKALDEAATKIGLGAKETRETIQSGLRTGRAKPRQPDFFSGNGKPGTKKTATGAAATGTEPEPAAASEEGEEAEGATDAEGGKQSLSATLIKFALADSKLFHDAGGDCYATVKVKGHQETYKVGSRAHKDWLASLLYGKTQQAARTDALSDAVTILRAKALYDGAKMEAHVRLAEHDSAIYIDLCDDQWRQVKITESDWKVITSEDSPVRFVRAKGMLPLPEPKQGGALGLLRDLLNLPESDKDNWPLIAGWLASAFKPSNGDGSIIRCLRFTANKALARVRRNASCAI